MPGYNTIDVGYPYKLRGTNQQTNTGLLWRNPLYRANGTQRAIEGLALASYALHNRAGSAVVAGIGVRIPNELWIFGQWTNATTTFTDDTTDAQDTGTDDAALETTTNNDGFIVASRVPFNVLSFNVSTASAGGAAVRATRFSNAAGTAWATAISNLFIAPTTAGDYATGENVVAFAAPVDWGKSVSLATNLGDGYYAMNVRATTAPSGTAGKMTAMEIFFFPQLTEALQDNAILSDNFAAGELKLARDSVNGYYGDALVALFSTANDQNRVTAQVRPL